MTQATTPSRAHARRELDPPSRTWLQGLRSSGPRREQTIEALHDVLVRAARRELRRRGASSHRNALDHETAVHDIASDSLLSVLARLDDYRGDSRFTTWAYAFAANNTAAHLSRASRRQPSVSLDVAALEHTPDRFATTPEVAAQRRDAFRLLRAALERDLTDRQRRVFVAVALNDANVDALAQELRTNRNAVYKNLFDARRKLRSTLAAAGYAVSEPAP